GRPREDRRIRRFRTLDETPLTICEWVAGGGDAAAGRDAPRTLRPSAHARIGPARVCGGEPLVVTVHSRRVTARRILSARCRAALPPASERAPVRWQPGRHPPIYSIFTRPSISFSARAWPHLAVRNLQPRLPAALRRQDLALSIPLDWFVGRSTCRRVTSSFRTYRGSTVARSALLVALPLAPLLPTFDVALASAADREGAIGDVLGDHRAGGGGGAAADADRRHQHGVGANEGAGADVGWVLPLAVVVAGDDAGADVGLLPHRGVADVGEVVGLGAGAEPRRLDLDEVADPRARAEVGARAQPREGADAAAGCDDRAVEHAVRLDGDLVRERGVAQPRALMEDAAGADGAVAEDGNVGVDHGVGTDGDLGIDARALRLEHRHAGEHQLVQLALHEQPVHLRELDTRVDAEGFVGIGEVEQRDAAALLRERRHRVGEVQLALRVVG